MKTKITTVLLGLITSISFGQMTLVKTLKNIENHYFIDSKVTNFQSAFPDGLDPFSYGNDHRDEFQKYIRKQLISGNKIVSYDGWADLIIYDSEFNIQNQLTLDTAGIMQLTENYMAGIDVGFVNGQILKVLISDHTYNTDDKIEVIYYYKLRSGGSAFKIINEDGTLLYSEIKTAPTETEHVEEEEETVEEEEETVEEEEETVDYYNCTLGEKQEYNDFELALYKFGDKPYIIKNVQNLECKQSPYYENESLEFVTVSNDIQLYKLGGELPCSYMCNSNSTTNKSAELPSYDVNIYPNPTSSLLNIEIPMNLEVTKCEIYDGRGALLSSSFVNGGVNNVDVSQLTTGTYVCTLYNDQQFVHSEVFIKK